MEYTHLVLIFQNLELFEGLFFIGSRIIENFHCI